MTLMRVRHVHNFWDPRAKAGQFLQLLPPAPRMIGPQPFYPMVKPQIVPKPAPKTAKVKPAKHSTRKHGGQMVKHQIRSLPRSQKPKPVYGPPMPTDAQWSEMRWLANPGCYPAMPTHKQWRQMKKANNELMRLEAGSVLSAAAKRQEQLRQERIAGKVGYTSYSSLKAVQAS